MKQGTVALPRRPRGGEDARAGFALASAGALRRARSGSPGHFGSARSLINDRREFDMARCRRVVSSRRAAPFIKRRRLRNRRCACGGGAGDTPRHQGWVGPRRSERGFINLSIGVVRRHVRFGVVHEGYNHEPGAKGVVATLHACESLRRATVALEPAGTGALKAARSPRGGSIERGVHSNSMNIQFVKSRKPVCYLRES